MPITDLLNDIAKKFDLQVGSLSQVVQDVTWLTTGNLGIDHVAGNGLPLGRSVELYGPPSSGKAQPLNALVLTPDGYVKMGELRVGQTVSDPAGAYSTVTGIYPQGVQRVYRITFSDGTSAEATGDHLWNVEVYASAFGFLPATVTTDQLAARIRCSAGRPRVRLVPVEPVVFRGAKPGTPERLYLPVHPYLLGLLLGDGTFDRAISFTTKDNELLDAVRRFVPSDCEVRPASERTQGITWRINGLATYIRDLGLGGLRSEAKYVPELYKHQPTIDRLALLQGLMDTDGHASSGTYNAGHGVGEFSSASRQLRDDVIWLARSLGLKAVPGKTKKGSYRNPGGELVPCRDSYRARIYETEQIRVFRLPRKLKPVQPGLHYNRELVSVEYVRDAQCQCISVSAESKMYVTDDFIPTHNTTTGLQAAADLQQKIIAEGRDEYILYLDYEHALDAGYCANLGLDVEHPSFLLAQPYSMEQGAESALKLIETGKVRLSVWDSVAAMAPIARLDGEFDQRTAAMNKARLMSGLMLQLTPLLHKHNCCAVLINHLMEAVEMTGRPGMPPKATTPGGKALKFYASLRLEYRQIGNTKAKAADALTATDTSQAVATIVKVKCTKNKLAPPLREAEVRVTFGRGFDNTWSALQVLLGHKIVKKTGAWYRFTDNLGHPDMNSGNSVHGESSVLRFADTHPDWRDQLIQRATTLIADQPDVPSSDTDPFTADPDVAELLELDQ